VTFAIMPATPATTQLALNAVSPMARLAVGDALAYRATMGHVFKTRRPNVRNVLRKRAISRASQVSQ
jgi:hypothetical protein